jgi:flagellar assembly protein FliH
MSWSKVVAREALAGAEIGPYRVEALAGGEPGQAGAGGEDPPPAESGIEAARLRAYEEGRERGRAEALADLDSALRALGEALKRAQALAEEIPARVAPRLLDLAVAIAEKIVGRSLEAEPELFAAIVERALAETAEALTVRLWINPEDHRRLLAARPDLLDRLRARGGTVEVVAAEKIPRGGCRVETELGVLEAGVDCQLAEIRRRLAEEAKG